MYVITANVKKKGQSTSQMTNDKDYHMILVIIIVVRGETMLQRALGSGWGVMIPGALIVALGMPECRLTYGGYWSRWAC